MVISNRTNPSWECSTCTDADKVQRGCESAPALPIIMMEGNVQVSLERCPLRGYYGDPASYNELFQYYHWMKQGFLPCPGSIDDQATAFVTYCMTITHALEEAERQVARKEEQARNMASRAARAASGGGGGGASVAGRRRRRGR